MVFLRKLKSLIKIDVDLAKLKKGFNLTINVNSNNKVDNRTINIDLNTLNEKKKRELAALLKGAVGEGNLLLEEDTESRFEDIKFVSGQQEYKDVVEYFTYKLSKLDLQILRMAVYLKSVSDRGESVDQLKLEIRKKYGERGNNIANLYSAGYFFTLIKPLYEGMAKDVNFSKDKFLERYNVIVMHYPFAVFVSKQMSLEDVEKEIVGKMERNKKYGIKTMNIHGIGKANVDKISEVLIQIKSDLIKLPTIESDQGLYYGDDLVLRGIIYKYRYDFGAFGIEKVDEEAFGSNGIIKDGDS